MAISVGNVLKVEVRERADVDEARIVQIYPDSRYWVNSWAASKVNTLKTGGGLGAQATPIETYIDLTANPSDINFAATTTTVFPGDPHVRLAGGSGLVIPRIGQRFYFEDVGIHQPNVPAGAISGIAKGLLLSAVALFVEDAVAYCRLWFDPTDTVHYGAIPAAFDDRTAGTISGRKIPGTNDLTPAFSYAKGYPVFWYNDGTGVVFDDIHHDLPEGNLGAGNHQYAAGPQRIWVEDQAERALKFGPKAPAVRKGSIKVEEYELRPGEASPQEDIVTVTNDTEQERVHTLTEAMGTRERIVGEWSGDNLDDGDADGTWVISGTDGKEREYELLLFFNGKAVLEREMELRV